MKLWQVSIAETEFLKMTFAPIHTPLPDCFITAPFDPNGKEPLTELHLIARNALCDGREYYDDCPDFIPLNAEMLRLYAPVLLRFGGKWDGPEDPSRGYVPMTLNQGVEFARAVNATMCNLNLPERLSTEFVLNYLLACWHVAGVPYAVCPMDPYTVSHSEAVGCKMVPMKMLDHATKNLARALSNDLDTYEPGVSIDDMFVNLSTYYDNNEVLSDGLFQRFFHGHCKCINCLDLERSAPTLLSTVEKRYPVTELGTMDPVSLDGLVSEFAASCSQSKEAHPASEFSSVSINNTVLLSPPGLAIVPFKITGARTILCETTHPSIVVGDLVKSSFTHVYFDPCEDMVVRLPHKNVETHTFFRAAKRVSVFYTDRFASTDHRGYEALKANWFKRGPVLGLRDWLDHHASVVLDNFPDWFAASIARVSDGGTMIIRMNGITDAVALMLADSLTIFENCRVHIIPNLPPCLQACHIVCQGKAPGPEIASEREIYDIIKAACPHPGVIPDYLVQVSQEEQDLRRPALRHHLLSVGRLLSSLGRVFSRGTSRPWRHLFDSDALSFKRHDSKTKIRLRPPFKTDQDVFRVDERPLDYEIVLDPIIRKGGAMVSSLWHAYVQTQGVVVSLWQLRAILRAAGARNGCHMEPHLWSPSLDFNGVSRVSQFYAPIHYNPGEVGHYGPGRFYRSGERGPMSHYQYTMLLWLIKCGYRVASESKYGVDGDDVASEYMAFMKRARSLTRVQVKSWRDVPIMLEDLFKRYSLGYHTKGGHAYFFNPVVRPSQDLGLDFAPVATYESNYAALQDMLRAPRFLEDELINN